ncbi:MAG: GNAT family N-acetyltransferase [Phycisphaerae bacterium]
MDDRPVVLVGTHARLDPLVAAHAEQLFDAGAAEEVWRHLIWAPFRSVADAEAYTRSATDETQLAFATLDARTGRVVGSTRYLDIRRPHRGLEIGWTWLTPAAQRTAINTECKWLLLRHAFETIGCERVQLKTDHLNERSQRAIERIGAVREGVLRRHMQRRDGTWRDTVMYSIIAPEWPAVRERLLELLRRDASA